MSIRTAPSFRFSRAGLQGKANRRAVESNLPAHARKEASRRGDQVNQKIKRIKQGGKAAPTRTVFILCPYVSK